MKKYQPRMVHVLLNHYWYRITENLISNSRRLRLTKIDTNFDTSIFVTFCNWITLSWFTHWTLIGCFKPSYTKTCTFRLSCTNCRNIAYSCNCSHDRTIRVFQGLLFEVHQQSYLMTLEVDTITWFTINSENLFLFINWLNSIFIVFQPSLNSTLEDCLLD